MAPAAFALLLAAQDVHLDALRDALRRTGEGGYAYAVLGRFAREGEVGPGGVLTSRMKQYRSVRHGDAVLVRGPEGLWRTPEERLGEKVENPDPEAPDIVRTLEAAGAPHRIVESLLADVVRGNEPEVREIDGRWCRRYVLYYRREALREALESQLERAVERGTLSRPDEVRWSSSMKGSLRIYLDRATGLLYRVVDERSVKLAYKVPDQQPELKTYRLEMEFELSAWGKAEPEIAPEVREKLGIDAGR